MLITHKVVACVLFQAKESFAALNIQVENSGEQEKVHSTNEEDRLVHFVYLCLGLTIQICII
jgi:hypothetical protein